MKKSLIVVVVLGLVGYAGSLLARRDPRDANEVKAAGAAVSGVSHRDDLEGGKRSRPVGASGLGESSVTLRAMHSAARMPEGELSGNHEAEPLEKEELAMVEACAGGRAECPTLEQSPEALRAMVRCGVIKYDVPVGLTSGALRLSEESLAAARLTEVERRALDERMERFTREWNEDVFVLARGILGVDAAKEVEGDIAATLMEIALVPSPSGESISRMLAEERAGLRPRGSTAKQNDQAALQGLHDDHWRTLRASHVRCRRTETCPRDAFGRRRLGRRPNAHGSVPRRR